MKLSLAWLQSFFTESLPTNSVVLSDTITAHTAEVEEVIATKTFYQHVFVGKLISAEKFTETLHKGQFDFGKKGQKQIVFGSVHPLEVGSHYSVALSGAKLQSGINIAESTIQNVKSEGMVADNKELGMKNDGLLNLNGFEVGTELAEIEAFDDILIDIDNKSLTHRPDLLGHAGFVPELALGFGTKAKDKEKAEFLPVQEKKHIFTPFCRRFMSAAVENIIIDASSLTHQLLLEHLGTRSINNVVDITNLVLLGQGQPMHAFDADKVEGNLQVRMAKTGEKLVALDGEEYILTPEDIVIADDVKVLSVAGIMGGLESGVTAKTTRIIFECASFCPVHIRKTAHRLKLRSESSMRYEKNLCPEQCEGVLHHALGLLQAVCSEMSVTRITEDFATPTVRPEIEVTAEDCKKILGITVEAKEIEQILTDLRFEVEKKDDILLVTPPYARATKDIAQKVDVLEEIARIKGYDALPEALPKMPLLPMPTNVARKGEHSARTMLIARGWREVKHRSLTTKGVVVMENPLNENTGFLRTNLADIMVQESVALLREQGFVKQFELGHVFLDENTEKNHIGLLLADFKKGKDAKTAKTELIRAMQQDVLALGAEFGHDFVFRPLTDTDILPELAHTAMIGAIESGDERVGFVFAVHPRFEPLKDAYFVVAELDLLLLTQKKTWNYVPQSAYPAVKRDISAFFPKQWPVWEIKQRLLAQEYVQKVELFDEMEDDAVFGEDRRSLAFHVTLQRFDETLNEEMIARQMATVVELLQNDFNAEIR